MRKLRALLFDLDGTLIDTEAANHAAYSRALGEFGVIVEPADVARTASGRQWRAFLPELIARAGVECDPARVARRKGELYREMLAGIPVNTALLALAASVRPLLRTALVTTASAANVDAVLRHFGLREAFDVVVTGDDVARHKPDADAYRLALRRLALDAEDCLAFEDSDAGVASAVAAGIAVVRVTFGR